MSTNDSPCCPQCGGRVPADAPGGLCPRCVMAMNLSPDTLATGGAPASAPPPAIEEIAPRFPQLDILECLGRGGMGVVYKARQRQLDRIVALKILAPERVTDAHFGERFQREAKALAKLNHPNIVTLYEFGQAEDLYYFLMEYVDGVSLRRLLEGARLPPEQALAIVPQICDALQYAHDRGVVHRDIKPENVLLDRQGRVKIADFGVARIVGLDAAGPAATAAQPLETEATAAGRVVGTPRYMAPEQAERPQTADHRADIYSLGVVFYEMLTGEPPRGRFEPPSHRVQVDVRLDEVVLRALEKAPERRYQQAGEVKTIVETIARTQAAPTVPPPVPAPPVGRSGFRQMLIFRPVEWVPVAAAIAITAIVIGWFIVNIFGMGEVDSSTDIDTRVKHAVLALRLAKFLAVPLLLLGVGAWLLRLNRWIKQPIGPHGARAKQTVPPGGVRQPSRTEAPPLWMHVTAWAAFLACGTALALALGILVGNPRLLSDMANADISLPVYLIAFVWLGSVVHESAVWLIPLLLLLTAGADLWLYLLRRRRRAAVLPQAGPRPATELWRKAGATVPGVLLVVGALAHLNGERRTSDERNSEEIEALTAKGAQIVYASSILGGGACRVDLGTMGRFSARDLQGLQACLGLRVLYMGHASLEPGAVEALGELTQLRGVGLGGPSISNDALAAVGKLVSLDWLGLAQTSITDEGLDHLRALQRLTSLNLSGTMVTDAGAQSLAAMPALESIDISGTEITDAGLRTLARLPALAELRLDGSPVSDSGVEELRATRPGVRIRGYRPTAPPHIRPAGKAGDACDTVLTRLMARSLSVRSYESRGAQWYESYSGRRVETTTRISEVRRHMPTRAFRVEEAGPDGSSVLRIHRGGTNTSIWVVTVSGGRTNAETYQAKGPTAGPATSADYVLGQPSRCYDGPSKVGPVAAQRFSYDTTNAALGPGGTRVTVWLSDRWGLAVKQVISKAGRTVAASSNEYTSINMDLPEDLFLPPESARHIVEAERGLSALSTAAEGQARKVRQVERHLAEAHANAGDRAIVRRTEQELAREREILATIEDRISLERARLGLSSQSEAALSPVLSSGASPEPTPTPDTGTIDLRAGLVLHYTFDEDEDGKIVDRSGSGHSGTAHGGVWTADGRSGGAYRFRAGAEPEYISVDDPSFMRKASGDRFSVSAWFSRDSLVMGEQNTILDINDAQDRRDDGRFNYYLVVGGNPYAEETATAPHLTSVGFCTSANRVSTRGATLYYGVGTDEWMHVVGVYDAGICRLYVNGREQDSRTYRGPPVARALHMQAMIGNSLAGSRSRQFRGRIDEVRFYDRAISAGEARALYELSAPAPAAVEVLLLRADDTDGVASFTDAHGHPVSASGTMQVSAAAGSPTGRAAARFDGNAAYLSLPRSDDWAFGTDDFTVDLWACCLREGPASEHLVGPRLSDLGRCDWAFVRQGDRLQFLVASATVLSAEWRPRPERWYHLAVTRRGGQAALFIDGVRMAGAFCPQAISNTIPLTIGATIDPHLFFRGQMAEVRILKGQAAWTDDFALPVGTEPDPPGHAEQRFPIQGTTSHLRQEATGGQAVIDGFLATCAREGITNAAQMEALLGLSRLRELEKAGVDPEKADRSDWHPVLKAVLGPQAGEDPFKALKQRHIDKPSPYQSQAIMLLKVFGYKTAETKAVSSGNESALTHTLIRPKAPAATDRPRTLYEDGEFRIVGVDYGRAAAPQTPGLYVLLKKTQQWVQVQRIPLKGATLGRSPTDEECRAADLRPPSIGWDFRPLAQQHEVAMPLDAGEALFFPDKIERDDERGVFLFRFNSAWSMPFVETVLIVPIAELKPPADAAAPTHTGIRLSDSMSISAKPIRAGEPVTFRHVLEPKRRALVQAAMTNRFGAPGFAIAPTGGEQIALSAVEVTDVRVTRRVMVRQGGKTVLYQREDELTPENMDRLFSWTTVSTEWKPIDWSGGSVDFVIDYWRSYKTSSGPGSGGHSIAGDQAVVPIAGPTSSNAAAPGTVARTFLRACEAQDWDEAMKYIYVTESRPASVYLHDLKLKFTGAQILEIGQPFRDNRYRGWFVPYKVKPASGEIRERNLAIRNDVPGVGWFVDGGM